MGKTLTRTIRLIKELNSCAMAFLREYGCLEDDQTSMKALELDIARTTEIWRIGEIMEELKNLDVI